MPSCVEIETDGSGSLYSSTIVPEIDWACNMPPVKNEIVTRKRENCFMRLC